ncbi:MAG: hypothetical protein LBJ18_01175 [Rickettsiales bacterium]|jgi:hypothetical protein|nr:hypothetical protein [Rickettsiales bacterium]
MNYPSDFETPAFPAGKRIAISRSFGIWSLTAFLIIIFLCGILLWTARSQRLSPILISGDWTVIGKNDSAREYSVAQAMQESVALNFARQWFQISNDAAANSVRWCRGERHSCPGSDDAAPGVKPCLIFCAGADDLYTRFSNAVLPDYEARAKNGEIWTVAENSLDISPVGNITESSGNWRVRATIESNLAGAFRIEAYLAVARNKNNYPRNLGFYVADFNAYKTGN